MLTTTSDSTQRPTPDSAQPWPDSSHRTKETRLRSGHRRRRVPHLVLGALLVPACATGFAVVSVTTSDRQPVLVLARPVLVGHLLTAPDLREVNVVVDPSVTTVPAAQARQVVGRVLSTSLPAGSLLPPGALGDGSMPSAGSAVAALALKPGQFPPEIAAGAHVSVVSAPPANSAISSAPVDARTWPATVVSVTERASEQATVVSVELAEADALQVAAVPAGQVSVVMVFAGGGR